ncbi:MAG: ABC transporter ATP-binding protein [Candidatus Thorarchaeota archaeon]|nr:ABC transporter ATP-binding protein [Candidatus Thorarchaeota archaeon]
MEDTKDLIESMPLPEVYRLAGMLKVPLTQRVLRRSILIDKVVSAIDELDLFTERPSLKDPAIEITNLKKKFGKTMAVRNLDLVVHPGEIVGLVGPNGAGKTTSLRILAGIIRPTSGAVKVNGIPMSDNAIDAKRDIGYIPERPSCYESLRVREYLSFIAKIYGVPPIEAAIRVYEFSHMLQLYQYIDSYIGTLSKGNLQRTLLAGIFVRPEPYILAFDEPIYGLDPRGAWSLKQHIRRLRNRGSAILISTHILEVAEDLCDRFVIMHEGRVVGQGTYDELHEQFPDTQNLEEIFLELTGGIPQE